MHGRQVTAIGSSSSGGVGQLAAGHWYSSVGTFFASMYAVYPRPDSETSTYARHRWAYYDGVNEVEYRVDVGVQYGGWPYWYELIAGPTGMTVGELYGDSDYGQVRWIPDGDVTNATVTVRVHDQDGNTLDVTWTVSTSSSTSVFMFAHPDDGDDNDNGSFGAPVQTLQELFGASEGTTTYPNRIVYLRGGTYPLYTQTAYGIRMYQGRTPMALVRFPGETVALDQSTAGSICALNCSTGAHDLYLDGFSFTGQPTSTNYYSVRVGEAQNRMSFIDLSFPDAYRGSNANNNASCIYGNSTGTSARTHWYMKRCSATNFGATGGGGNAWGLGCLFTTNRILVDECSDLSNRRERAIMYLKASCANAEIRESRATMNSTSVGILTGTQPDLSLNQGPTLIRHNKVHGGSTSGHSISLDESQSGQGGSLIQDFYVVRNSGIGSLSANGDATESFPGRYVLAENVVQSSNNLVRRNYQNIALNNITTSTNNVGGSSGWLNATTLNLEPGHLDVLGTRGAEIA